MLSTCGTKGTCHDSHSDSLDATLAVYVNQTNLNVKLSTKLGGEAGDQPKTWTTMAHSPPRPLRIPTVYTS